MLSKFIYKLPKWNECSWSDRFYIIGILILVIYFSLLFLVTVKVIDLTAFSNIHLFVLPIMIIFSLGVILEFKERFIDLLSKPIVNWIIGTIGILAYKLSEMYSALVINRFIKVDPSYFSLASSILTVLYLPLAWGVALSFIWISIALYMQLLGAKSKGSLGSIKTLVRVIGFIGLCVFTLLIISFFEYEKSDYTKFVKEIILESEYYYFTPCKNVLEMERVAMMGENVISIYDPKTEKFRVEKCKLEMLNN